MKNTAYTNSHKPVTPPDHVALTEETGTTNQAWQQGQLNLKKKWRKNINNKNWVFSIVN